MKIQLIVLSTCCLLTYNPLNAANYLCDVCQDRKMNSFEEDPDLQSSDANEESDKRKTIHQADHALLDRIHDSVESNGGYKKCKDVNIRVSDGHVTLTGTVKSEKDRVFIVERVKKIDKDRIKKLNEVRSINDQLITVNPSSNTPRANKVNRLVSDASSPRLDPVKFPMASPVEIDRQLSTKIDKVLKETLKDTDNAIAVEVRNGIVTLSGSVDKESVKRDIEQEVRETPGVKGTNNLVKVSGRKSP